MRKCERVMAMIKIMMLYKWSFMFHSLSSSSSFSLIFLSSSSISFFLLFLLLFLSSPASLTNGKRKKIESDSREERNHAALHCRQFRKENPFHSASILFLPHLLVLLMRGQTTSFSSFLFLSSSSFLLFLFLWENKLEGKEAKRERERVGLKITPKILVPLFQYFFPVRESLKHQKRIQTREKSSMSYDSLTITITIAISIQSSFQSQSIEWTWFSEWRIFFQKMRAWERIVEKERVRDRERERKSSQREREREREKKEWERKRIETCFSVDFINPIFSGSRLMMLLFYITYSFC